MSREKQIEEMAKDMCNCCRKAVTNDECDLGGCDGVRLHAEALYNAGYRKQSEGEWIERKVTMWATGGKPYFRYEQECSNCGFINKSKKRWSSKYCPECGAKMKGGAE